MKVNTVFIIIVVLAAAAVGAVYILKGQPPLSGVTVGNEYTATTTPSGVQTWADGIIKVGYGALGSVIVTKAGNTEFVLYDATSTGAIVNDSRFVKSKQQLARITENLAAGTYVFDVNFNNGLVIDVERGTTGTSTITFR